MATSATQEPIADITETSPEAVGAEQVGTAALRAQHHPGLRSIVYFVNWVSVYGDVLHSCLPYVR
jgi:hypothetical protein